jgi:membrane fusion protein (multidrug efflux system)
VSDATTRVGATPAPPSVKETIGRADNDLGAPRTADIRVTGTQAPSATSPAGARGQGQTPGGGEQIPRPEPARELTRPRGTLRRLALPLAAGVAILLLIAGVVYWRANAGLVKTDNAQTAGNIAPISAQVAGTVTKVDVIDNQRVTSGTVLVELDPADYRLALNQARANLAAAEAQVLAAQASLAAQQAQFTSGVRAAQGGLAATAPRLPQAQSQLTMQEGMTAAQVAQAQAQVSSARASLAAALSNVQTAARTLARDRQLYAQGAIASQQLDVDTNAYSTAQAQYQSAQEALRQAQANLASAQAARQQVEIARTNVAASQGQVVQAQAQVQQAQAGAAVVNQRAQELAVAKAQAATAAQAVQTAELNLSRTQIRAPADGVVTNRTVEIGQVVQPNVPLLSLTLSNDVWVVANIKETQVGRIRVGDPVRITVDAFRGRAFRGHVQSIGAATGSTTALLPPDNATGNFVKVIQLVPVRITLDPGASDPPLQVGLSAEVSIDTRHTAR